MVLDIKQVIEDAKGLSVVNAALIKVADLNFSDEVRKSCEMNRCGNLGKNWACPPAVGPIAELKEKALSYQKGLVLQTVHLILDSFDYEGMMEGEKAHEESLRAVLHLLKEKYGLSETLMLGAGCCTLCQKCTFAEGKPCCFPDKALASLEAYGIDVIALTKLCEIPYNHGPGTVAYVGLILLKEKN